MPPTLFALKPKSLLKWMVAGTRVQKGMRLVTGILSNATIACFASGIMTL
jgi:hypothetical protein